MYIYNYEQHKAVISKAIKEWKRVIIKYDDNIWWEKVKNKFWKDYKKKYETYKHNYIYDIIWTKKNRDGCWDNESIDERTNERIDERIYLLVSDRVSKCKSTDDELDKIFWTEPVIRVEESNKMIILHSKDLVTIPRKYRDKVYYNIESFVNKFDIDDINDYQLWYKRLHKLLQTKTNDDTTDHTTTDKSNQSHKNKSNKSSKSHENTNTKYTNTKHTKNENTKN